MKKLEYSPDALQKLREIKHDVEERYGTDKAKEIIHNMTKSFRSLQQFENRGPSVESILGIPCDYRFLFVQHNYAFYSVEYDRIRIVDIYNEKEDFMWKLFGIKTTTQESEDY